MVDVLQSWLNWFHFLFLEGGLLIILTNCTIFRSPFLDVTRISMSAVSFLAQLESRITRNLLTVGFFWRDFPHALIFLRFLSCNSMSFSGCPASRGVYTKKEKKLSQTMKLKEIELIIQTALKLCMVLQTNIKPQ